MVRMNNQSLDDSYELAMRERRRAIDQSLNSSVDSEIMAQNDYTPAIDEGVLRKGSDKNKSFIERINKIENQKKLRETLIECKNYIEDNKIEKLVELLSAIFEFNVNDLVDDEGYSLVHMAVSKNRQKMFDAIMKHARSRLTQEAITSWINQTTHEERFTALHYASFRGNVHICRVLIDNGADMNDSQEQEWTKRAAHRSSRRSANKFVLLQNFAYELEHEGQQEFHASALGMLFQL